LDLKVEKVDGIIRYKVIHHESESRQTAVMKALLYVKMAALKDAFAVTAIPHPKTISTKDLAKNVSWPPREDGMVIEPFFYGGVWCDLNVKSVGQQGLAHRFEFTALSGRNTGFFDILPSTFPSARASS
jgi:hypothetical protein